jgi:hypothetical protein
LAFRVRIWPNDEEVKGKVILGIPPKPYLAVLADACVAFPIENDNNPGFRGKGSKFLTPSDPYKGKKPIAYRTIRDYELEQLLYNPGKFFTDEVLQNTLGIGFSREDLAEYTLKWMGVADQEQVGGGIQARSDDLEGRTVVSCAKWFIPFYKQIKTERLIHLKINIARSFLENMPSIPMKIIQAEHQYTYVYQVDEVELQPLMA